MLTSAQLDSPARWPSCSSASPPAGSMRLGVLAALDQRIGVRYAMAPMTSHETRSLPQHHLKLAGRSDPLFSDDAAELIHTTSRGFPRAVNNLATGARRHLRRGKAIVDEHAARAAITEVTDT